MLNFNITSTSIIEKFAFNYIKFLLLALLLLGTHFSKFNVVGPIYLYDILLFLFVPVLLFFWRFKKYDIPILGALSVAFIYLFIYFFISKAKLDILLRQFMLFGYLLASYFYFSAYRKIPNFLSSAIKFIVSFGKLSFIIQSIYIVIVLIFITRNIYAPDQYFYYSPILILGLIVYAIYKLVYAKYKLLWAIPCLLLLTTTGHSSAFLSFLAAIIFYFINKQPKVLRIAFVILAILGLVLLITYSKQFSDGNAQWRFFYWLFTLKNIFITHFGLLGNGFGVPYSDEQTAYFLEIIKEFTTHLSDEEESYLSPMHNSFLTMAFHIGFLFSVFIMLPIFKVVKAIFLNPVIKDKEYLFLALSLIGVSVWAANNVILELPHSSLFYWFIYFAFVFKINDLSIKSVS